MQIESDLKKYYAMSDADKDAYMSKLLKDIEDGKETSAAIHTEQLIKRCKA
jgi:hypothetical protein